MDNTDKRIISNGTLVVARGAIRDRIEFLKSIKALDAEDEAIFLRAIDDINEQYKYQSLAGVGSNPL